MSLRIPICAGCGRAVFPQRLLCPDCGGAEWRHEPVDAGVLEAATERAGVWVGFVRTSLGPVVVARVEGGHHRGAEVMIDEDGDVPVARAPS
jgi:hypothetical protein